MSGKIKKLKDANGDFIIPVTHPSAVIDENGRSVTERLSEVGGGKSAYQTWLDLGNSGTEAQFIQSLKGPKGDTGESGTGVLGKLDMRDVEIKPLYMPSACGYYQHYHPSVVYIENGWNGYKYWMAETPYPHYSTETGEPWENPHIFCSNDGFEWIVPEGLTNPIDDREKVGVGYLSDTHLVYIPETSTLECWYRGSNSSTQIYRKLSTNGVIWAERELMFTDADGHTSNLIGKSRLSPAIIRENGQYRMWYLADTDIVYSAVSSDGKVWTDVSLVTITGLTNAGLWHLDVIYNNFRYYLVGYSKTGNLHLYSSPANGNGKTFAFHKTLLATSEARGKDFFGSNLYRASLVACGRRDGHPLYRLYFSGHNSTQEYAGIGVMEGRLESLKLISGDLHLRKQGYMKGIEVVNTRVNKADIQLADTGECIGFDYETKEPYFQKADGTKIYFTR